MCLGVPGRVVELLGQDLARADVSGNQVQISTRLTPEVQAGDYVLIHAGFAMEIIDEEWARETLALLKELEQHAR
ncbi:MAG: HypC/HybG/HupF family hydrogenase formation chaperone [Syntrophomonadaceae bacterium]|nr:HypC/HybG/HupF family hydrogenase formation chaperone [Syntrophomonadaceae bacterium]